MEALSSPQSYFRGDVMLNTLHRRAFMASTAAVAVTAALRPTFAADEFSAFDAVGQASLVRHKKATALDLVNAAAKRIDAANPKLNAVVTEFFDRARTAAKDKLPDGPLTGVPYLIKDLDNVAGIRTTSGSRLMAHDIARENGPLADKAIAGGMVLMGKTNTPEFGLTATTESILLGACHNPWALDRSTGGSSGGAAAAVASGMVPVAHATDGGGSIRIPASCCGVFGMKPSRGRMKLGDTLPGDIAVENCVSRTVRDSATVFAMSENNAAAAPLKPVGFVAGPSKRRLNIGFGTANYFGLEPDADVKAALEETAKLCAGLGHAVVPVKTPIDGETFIDAFLTVWASGPANLVALAKSKGLKPEDVLEPWTLGLAEFFARKPKDAMAKSLVQFKEAEAEVTALFKTCDAWLTPVLASPPPELGYIAPTVPFQTCYDRIVKYVSYTPIHNVAGTPAMSVPLGMSKAGLPIGSQFAAAQGGEATLFALAYELESARPWAARKPGIWVG